METVIANIANILPGTTGYIYPNEYELHWGLLIVIYPYLTGLVAGAFILASLERVFRVHEITPVYRLSLVTALAFLIIAPLPLLAHLGHPERSFEMFLTPNTSSAMAMFGFVYAWYLMGVLLLELWLDYRRDIVKWSNEKTGLLKYFYKFATLGSTDLSPKALAFDEKASRFITILGVPSAFLLHGYVGFIFGSIKANPWWSSVLMPIVFLFSAIVSGIALMILVYMISTMFRWKKMDMACLNKLASFLLYAMLIDFTLEALDFIHRLYESEESITILRDMISNRLFISLIIAQILLGSVAPLVGIILAKIGKVPDEMKRMLYFIAAILVQVGIFSTRWNVVVGGQLFSKSLRGLTVYKLELFGLEGLFMAIILLVAPIVILYVLVKLFPPWMDKPELEKVAEEVS